MMDTRSEKALLGVHADLVRVVRRAYANSKPELSFIVTEGLRTQARQQQLFNSGASKTLNSRHLTGHAVDLMATVNGKGRWDWPLYYRLAQLMKDASFIEVVPLDWGGDWKSFKDGPHFELRRSAYK
ncbi:D-alanyl-D-alanine carboxypeptidase [uncultured Caudovirales phage]|uniref:D-alanyl-D-alanine carboxypeptidase n=1 Tax=uncultured Caudovirales phage TaxID=2100421 RepID=A0A6J5P127_9CAUD|nr:D-alanyl-D-alanine carboxypeptidase [uncultured Caudovirales phage]